MSTFGRCQTVFAMHSDQLLHFNEFHYSETQNDIPIFQMTIKRTQSTTNRPVLTTSGVLTGAVLTG